MQKVIRYTAVVIGIVLVFAMLGATNSRMREPDNSLLWVFAYMASPLLPGIVLAWGMRGEAHQPRRFDWRVFVAFFLIPVVLMVVALSPFFMGGDFGIWVTMVLRIAGTAMGLVPANMLLFGMALVLSFREALPATSDAPRTPHWLIRYGAAVLGLILAISVNRYLDINMRRAPTREAVQITLILLALLPALPAILFTWGLRPPASAPRRFNIGALMLFTVLPLALALIPALAYSSRDLENVTVRLGSIGLEEAWGTLVKNFAMMAGMGVVFAFRDRAKPAPAPIPDAVITLDDAVSAEPT